MSLTSEQVAEMLARAEKATPGPHQTRFVYRLIHCVREHGLKHGLLMEGDASKDWNDADLWANSQQDITALAHSHELQRAEIERLTSRIQDIAASHQSNTESLLEVARERDAMKAELAVANEAAVVFRDKATDVEVLRRNDAAERARLTTERDEARLRREMSLEHAQAAIATVRNDVPE